MPTALKEDFIAGQAPGLDWGNGVAIALNDTSHRIYNILAYGAEDGTDSTAAIQAAIDAAYSDGGGIVYVPLGVYVISSALTLKYRVSLIGATPLMFTNGEFIGLSNPSPVRSLLRLKASANSRMLINDPTNGEVSQDPTILWQRSVIKDLAFDGLATSQNGADTEGIYITNCFGLLIQGCEISWTRSHAIYIENSNCINILDCHSVVSSQIAGKSNVYASGLTDSYIRGCEMGGGSGSVCRIGDVDSVKNIIANNFFFNSVAGSGLSINASDYNQIIGNRLDQNYTNGIELTNTDYCTLVGNMCDENGFGNSGGGAGILLATSTNNVISGNVCTEGPNITGSANQDYGIDVGDDCDYNAITGNMLRGNDLSGLRISTTGNNNIQAWGNPGAGGADEQPGRLSFTAQEFFPVTGSPAMGTFGTATRPAMMYDQSASEIAARWFTVPRGWSKFQVILNWVNAGAGSGDVVWVAGVSAFVATNDAGESPDEQTLVETSTAGSQNALVSHAYADDFDCVPGEKLCLRVRRAGAEVTDSLANDAGLVSVDLVKV